MDWYIDYVGKIRCIEHGIIIHIPTECRATNLARGTWRNRTDVGIVMRSLEFFQISLYLIPNVIRPVFLYGFRAVPLVQGGLKNTR